MKKLLGIVVLGLLLSGNAFADIFLKCGVNEIIVDKKYIYQYFGSGAVDKYKITNKTSYVVSGFYKGKSTNYDVLLDLDGKTITVNTKHRKSGIVGSYTKDCY